MHLDHLWLTDFRSYREAEFAPAPEGITVVTGPNAEGKTNLLEAVGYLATLRVFGWLALVARSDRAKDAAPPGRRAPATAQGTDAVLGRPGDLVRAGPGCCLAGTSATCA